MKNVKISTNVLALFLLPLSKELEKVRYWIKAVKFGIAFESRIKVDETEMVAIAKRSPAFDETASKTSGIKWYDIGDPYLLGVCMPDQEYLNDYLYIKEGKYTKISDKGKKRILEFWENPEVETFLKGVLKKDYRTYMAMIRHWEDLTGEKIEPGGEAYPDFCFNERFFILLGIDLKNFDRK